MPAPVVLAVDGNSLVHRSYHAQARTAATTTDGTPCWAVRGLLMQLVAAVERVQPDVLVVGFDDPDESQRRARWPQYKAHRVDKLDSLVDQLRCAVDALRALGAAVNVPRGLEADDVLASTAALVREQGGRTVIVTSDRDAFALIDEHTSVLRVINGGVDASPLLNADRLELLLGVRPDQYRDFAALRGDPSDNLAGVHGVGPRTAARLLAAFGSAAAAFDAPEEVRARLGPGVAARLAASEARAGWELNCQVMTMHADVPVDLATGALPLDPASVAAVFREHQLVWTVSDALRVLAGVADDEPRPRVPLPSWVDPAPSAFTRPALPKLPPRKPAPAQLALFDA